MPANLDESTQKIVLLVSSFTTAAIAIPSIYAQLVMIPNYRRQLSESGLSLEKSTPSLFVGCIASVALMIVATGILAVPVVSSFSNEPSQAQQQLLSSSINFCEQDFQSSPYIAEPTNVISSLTCYVPLALLGLVGRPSTQHRHAKRFMTIYATLLAIGLGSMSLHSLLTAKAQGGDELPMLWYTAAAAFCVLDVILQQQRQSTLLAFAVTGSAIAATVTYVFGRSDFTIFYILFSLYCQTIVFSILYITLGIDWEAPREHDDGTKGIQFKAAVLFPLAIATGWSTVFAIWVWVLEMLFCNAVTQDGDFGEVVAPFVWNRVLHPMWHFLSALLAWLLVQVIVAAHGMQRSWGVPHLEWFGAPYVVFDAECKKIE